VPRGLGGSADYLDFQRAGTETTTKTTGRPPNWSTLRRPSMPGPTCWPRSGTNCGRGRRMGMSGTNHIRWMTPVRMVGEQSRREGIVRFPDFGSSCTREVIRCIPSGWPGMTCSVDELWLWRVCGGSEEGRGAAPNGGLAVRRKQQADFHQRPEEGKSYSIRRRRKRR
jgi:hypothetical protein